MPQPRKFDHDEARRRYAAGEGGPTLARAFGVSPMAIYRVVNPKVNAQMALHAADLVRRKRKPCLGGCGALVWLHGARGRTATGYCRTCHGIQRSKTVRDTTLLCCTCNEWKPDEDFPRSSSQKSRRLRAQQCRSCQTVTRRERRHANREASNAYDREYRRRRRCREAGRVSDTENTTYRHYPIQVGPDRIIVQGPNRTRAEFTTMAAARHFIKTLCALEMTGTAGEEPAAAAEFTLGAPGPVISSASALTEPEMPKRPEARPASLGVDPSVMGGSVSCSVSATTAEPCVNNPTSNRQGADGNQRSGSSDLVALNYLRGME